MTYAEQIQALLEEAGPKGLETTALVVRLGVSRRCVSKYVDRMRARGFAVFTFARSKRHPNIYFARREWLQAAEREWAAAADARRVALLARRTAIQRQCYLRKLERKQAGVKAQSPERGLQWGYGAHLQQVWSARA